MADSYGIYFIVDGSNDEYEKGTNTPRIALNSGKRFPATTDPWSVHCMVKLLKEKGAGKILVSDQNGLVLAFDK